MTYRGTCYLSLIFVVLFSLSAFNAVGKPKNPIPPIIDSLEQVLKDHDKNDVTKVKLYIEIAKKYYNTDISKLKDNSELAFKLADSIGYDIGKARSLFLIGVYHRLNRNYDSALIHFNPAVEIFLKYDSIVDAARCYNDIGTTALGMKDYPLATQNYEKAKEIFGQNKNYGGVAATYMNLGLIAKHMEDYPKAIKLYKKSLSLYEIVKDKANQSLALKNIASEYYQTGNYSIAITYLMDALHVARESGNKLIEGSILRKIGIVFFEREEYKESLKYHLESLKVYEGINRKSSLPISYNNVASVYIELDSLDKALQYFNKSIEANTSSKNHSNLASSYRGIAQIYSRTGKQKETGKYFNMALKEAQLSEYPVVMATTNNSYGKYLLQDDNYLQAQKHFEQGLSYAEKGGRLVDAKEAAEGLSITNEKLHDFKNSLKYHKRYKQLADSILNTENTKRIAQEITKAQYEEEIQELEQGQREKERAMEQEKQHEIMLRNTFIVAFIFLLVLAILIFLNLQRKRKTNRTLARLNKEIELQKEELEATNEKLIELGEFKQGMTGMIVHDLKNPLNAILNPSKSLSQENQLNASKQYGRQMLNMVLNILDLQKYQESKMILDLSSCSINQVANRALEEVLFLREAKNIELHNKLSTDYIVMADPEILRRVFVNLLTNAIKFTPNHGEIIVASEITSENFLKISVSDSGDGIPKDKLSKVFDRFVQVQMKESGNVKSTGLGLTFCKIAVEAHGGEISAESEPGSGSTFWFTIQRVADRTSNHTEVIKTRTDPVLPKLTLEELTEISSCMSQLQETKIYKISLLRKILSEIDENTSENIKSWKNLVEKAISLEDQETYNLLTDSHKFN